MSHGVPSAKTPPDHTTPDGTLPGQTHIVGTSTDGTSAADGTSTTGSCTVGSPATRGAVALCCGAVSVAFLASGIAAAVGGWRPSWDTAFIQLRVLDVATGRTPLIGMPSTVSQSLAAPAHHPGPLHFWLLALPTLLTRSIPAGLAIAQAMVNATLAGLSLLAVRAAGSARNLWAATAVWLIATVLIGDELLHDPWNPHMATVALLAAFISTAALWRGDSAIAIIAVMVAASVAAQSHLSALIPSVALVVTASIAVVRRRGWRSTGRQAFIAFAVLAVCWSGPLLDQLLHRPGNLRTLATAGDSLGTSFGFVAGFDRLARTVTPPGLIRSGLPSVMTGAGLWVGRVVLVVLVAVVILTGLRRSRRSGCPAAGTPALVLASATWLGQSITPITFGSVFGRHMWELMWPAALALWTAAIAGAATEARTRIVNKAHASDNTSASIAAHELSGFEAPTASRQIWPALLVAATVLLIVRPMVSDVESQRDGRWFSAIAAAADASPHDRFELTIVTNGIAIESELVAGVAADLARRGTLIRFTGTVSAGLLHSERLVANPDDAVLLFTTVGDDPLAYGLEPLAIIKSPVPTEISGTISIFLIEPTR